MSAEFTLESVKSVLAIGPLSKLLSNYLIIHCSVRLKGLSTLKIFIQTQYFILFMASFSNSIDLHCNYCLYVVVRTNKGFEQCQKCRKDLNKNMLKNVWFCCPGPDIFFRCFKLFPTNINMVSLSYPGSDFSLLDVLMRSQKQR